MGRLAAVVAKALLTGHKVRVVRCEQMEISGTFFRYCTLFPMSRSVFGYMMNNYTTKSESYDHTLHALPTEALNYLPGIFFSELKPNYLLV